jgi:PPOX class probable F420-dependent enzyme
LSSKELEEFLSRPNVAVVATMDPDGQPHAVPTWYEWGDGEIVFHTGQRTRKYRNLRNNPLVTFCIDQKTPPYRAAVVYGKAEMTVGTDDERVRRCALAYLGPQVGSAYADQIRGQRVVIVQVKAEHITSWDYGKGDNP